MHRMTHSINYYLVLRIKLLLFITSKLQFVAPLKRPLGKIVSCPEYTGDRECFFRYWQ